jgi:hypothetical protein
MCPLITKLIQVGAEYALARALEKVADWLEPRYVWFTRIVRLGEVDEFGDYIVGVDWGKSEESRTTFHTVEIQEGKLFSVLPQKILNLAPLSVGDQFSTSVGFQVGDKTITEAGIYDAAAGWDWPEDFDWHEDVIHRYGWEHGHGARFDAD